MKTIFSMPILWNWAFFLAMFSAASEMSVATIPTLFRFLAIEIAMQPEPVPISMIVGTLLCSS